VQASGVALNAIALSYETCAKGIAGLSDCQPYQPGHVVPARPIERLFLLPTRVLRSALLALLGFWKRGCPCARTARKAALSMWEQPLDWLDYAAGKFTDISGAGSCNQCPSGTSQPAVVQGSSQECKRDVRCQPEMEWCLD
jgi:hypothetical protein